jgi:hypothetical protein
MTNEHFSESPNATSNTLRAEYKFDYTQARPNRFVRQVERRSRTIVLEPDVAAVFTTPESVNAVLRALITTMPPTARRP